MLGSSMQVMGTSAISTMSRESFNSQLQLILDELEFPYSFVERGSNRVSGPPSAKRDANRQP